MIFELEAVGGPWMRRLAGRRAFLEDLAWDDLTKESSPELAEQARIVWTQSGDFVVDEMLHAELSARVATALGGAVPLEVDLTKLVRPPAASASPLLRAAELVLRTSCIGEALTVPILKQARTMAGSALVATVLARVIEDESAHAELGSWFLDWAAPKLNDADRAELGRIAGASLRSFAPVFGGACTTQAKLGVLDCASFDATFAEAVARRVVRPLAARGIVIPPNDLSALAT